MVAVEVDFGNVIVLLEMGCEMFSCRDWIQWLSWILLWR